MSEIHFLRCDGCGRTLQMPNSVEGQKWQRLTDDRKTFHWCGECGGLPRIYKRFERGNP